VGSFPTYRSKRRLTILKISDITKRKRKVSDAISNVCFLDLGIRIVDHPCYCVSRYGCVGIPHWGRIVFPHRVGAWNGILVRFLSLIDLIR